MKGVVLFLFSAQLAAATISDQRFRLQGELVWSFGTNTLRYPTEALRDGDVVKLREVLQPEEINYHEAVYLRTPQRALSFYQFTKELTTEQEPGGSSNNGQVSISNHRMPEAVTLLPIWLMLIGQEDVTVESGKPRQALFAEGRAQHLHERRRVKARSNVDSDWKAGFSHYEESFTNSVSKKPRHTKFEINAWTNVNGIKYPKSCVGSCSDFDVRFEFVVNRIEALTEPVNLRVPNRSSVIDWRPKEEKKLTTGCSYSITNGIVIDNIVRDAKKYGIEYGPALDWAQSNPMPVGTKAPDFTATDLDGRTLKLSDFRGQYVFLNFWSTTCGPCIGEFPWLKESYERVGRNDKVIFIGLALDDDARAVRRILKEKKIEWRQVMLTKEFDDKIARKYKVNGIPENFLIGPDGKIVGKTPESFLEGE